MQKEKEPINRTLTNEIQLYKGRARPQPHTDSTSIHKIHTDSTTIHKIHT